MRTTLIALFALGCEAPEDPEFRYGVRLSELEFEVVSPDMGIHPDQSILRAPGNPFSAGLTGDTKWDVLQDGPVAAFYAWATALIGQPTGEHQYYTALQLHGIYEQQLADPEDLVLVQDLAIRAYQSMLDNFPGAVTYDATGRIQFDLMPQAINGIHALGGEVLNGWVIVPTGDGGFTAVQRQ